MPQISFISIVLLPFVEFCRQIQSCQMEIKKMYQYSEIFDIKTEPKSVFQIARQIEKETNLFIDFTSKNLLNTFSSATLILYCLTTWLGDISNNHESLIETSQHWKSCEYWHTGFSHSFSFSFLTYIFRVTI